MGPHTGDRAVEEFCGELESSLLGVCRVWVRVESQAGPWMPWWPRPPPSGASLCSPFFLAAVPPPLLHSGTWLSAPLPPLRLHCQHSSLQGHEKEPLFTKSWGALVFGGRSHSKMTVWDEPALKWNHPSKVYLELGQGPVHHGPWIPAGSLSYRVPCCLGVLTTDRFIIAIKRPVYEKREGRGWCSREPKVPAWLPHLTSHKGRTWLPLKAGGPVSCVAFVRMKNDEQRIIPLNVTPRK